MVLWTQKAKKKTLPATQGQQGGQKPNESGGGRIIDVFEGLPSRKSRPSMGGAIQPRPPEGTDA